MMTRPEQRHLRDERTAWPFSEPQIFSLNIVQWASILQVFIFMVSEANFHNLKWYFNLRVSQNMYSSMIEMTGVSMIFN